MQAAIATQTIQKIMKKRSIIRLFSTSLLAFLVISCAGPQTPADRIAERPNDFDQLSEKHQNLVQKGQITKGMPTTGVALAWGSPSRRSTGEQNGKRFESWTYNRYRSQFVNSVGVGFGGFGPYGGHRFGGFGPWGGGFGPWGGGFGGQRTDVIWIPERAAVVRFRNNRVYAWEASN